MKKTRSALDNPKPRNEEIDIFGVTHRGLVRAVNQDHFLISVLTEKLTMLQTSLPVLPDRAQHEGILHRSGGR